MAFIDICTVCDKEALFALPAGILRTTSVLIYYETEETGGSCSSISIHISDTMLSGRMALWAMPGMLLVILEYLLPNLI
jgi:hypothetical protein